MGRLREWINMKRRGERRIAPGNRGRVYERKNGDDGVGGTVAGKSVRKGTISARVYRASTGTWEDLGVIAEAHIQEK